MWGCLGFWVLTMIPIGIMVAIDLGYINDKEAQGKHASQGELFIFNLGIIIFVCLLFYLMSEHSYK